MVTRNSTMVDRGSSVVCREVDVTISTSPPVELDYEVDSFVCNSE